METTTLTVTESGTRLDRYVAEHRRDLSRAAAQRLIDDAHIRVDGLARKPSYRVQIGETITIAIPPSEPAPPRAENIPLDILYEDDDLIVINKSAGMIVHPAVGHRAGTLVNAILAHCPDLNIGGAERPGIAHRLDSETSGIIVVAKNDAALRELQAQFQARRVHKTYLALVEGIVKPPRGKIDAPIGRDPKHRQKMAVIPMPSDQSLGSKDTSLLKRASAQSAEADLNLDRRRIYSAARARAAVTVYRALAQLPRAQPSDQSLGLGASPLKRADAQSAAAHGAYTLIEAEPQTGRTHQIRVHLAFLGFPVVADAVYGKRKNALGLTRQFLHAWKIAFTLPHSGRAVNFVAPLPADLRAALAELGFDVGELK